MQNANEIDYNINVDILIIKQYQVLNANLTFTKNQFLNPLYFYECKSLFANFISHLFRLSLCCVCVCPFLKDLVLYWNLIRTPYQMSKHTELTLTYVTKEKVTPLVWSIKLLGNHKQMLNLSPKKKAILHLKR